MAASDDMPGKQARNGFNARKAVWCILTMLFALSLVLAALSIGSYTEVARAMVLTDLSVDHHAQLTLDGAGFLNEVNMTVSITIHNPSRREVRVWVASYKSWVRDLPLEAGLDTSRRWIDGTVVVKGTEQRYYPVFVATFSFGSPHVIVPPGSNVTIHRSIVLNDTRFPEIMSNFRSIYEHAVSVGLELEWKIYASGILFVHDIPEMPDAYRNAVMIRRVKGVDLTSGSGGAFP